MRFNNLLLLTLIAVLSSGINAVTFSGLQNQVVGTVGGSVRLWANISNVSNSTLSWVVGTRYVVNVTVTNIGGKASVRDVKSMNESLYFANFKAAGSAVSTNLTLNNLVMSLNGTEVKIIHGSTESNTARLIIQDTSTNTITMSPTTTGEGTAVPNITSPSMTSPNKTTTKAAATPSTTAQESMNATTAQKSMTVAPTQESPTATIAQKSTTAAPTQKETTRNTALGGCPSSGPGAPPDGSVPCTEVDCNVTLENQNSTMSSPGVLRTCTVMYKCEDTERWSMTESNCKCAVVGTWGPNCTKACGGGCNDVNGTRYCDVATGKCFNATGSAQVECADGYREPPLCDEPICGDCNGGECLRPGFCGNCPRHFEHGVSCRNLRLDGFLKGSIPSLAILGLIVIVLTIISRWHIRRKIKEA